MMIDMAEVREVAESDLSGIPAAADREFLEQHLEEWYFALREITQDIEQQSRARKAALEQRRVELLEQHDDQRVYLDLRCEYFDWHRRAMGFKTIVQRRMEHVKLERNRQRDDRYASRVNRELYSLRQAVQAHKMFLQDRNLDPCEADLDLWAAVQSCEPQPA